MHALLGALAAPPTYVIPEYVEAHTRHYLPDVAYSTDKVIDAFAVFERGGELAVTWPVDLEPDERAALETLAAQLPYVGRADSICDARLLADGDPVPEGAELAPLAASDGGAPTMRLLAVDAPLDVGLLVARTADVRKARMLVPPGTHWQEYQRPAPVDPMPVDHRPSAPRRCPTAVRWAIGSPAKPSVKATLAMTDVLRQACMSRFGKLNGDGVSDVLAGKTADGAPLGDHRHAHYLALDTDGDRLLDTLLVWVPSGLSRAEVDALATLSRLRGYGHVADFRQCQLGLEAVGPIDAVAPELVASSRRWKSVTPFAPARYGRRRTPWEEHIADQVQIELGYRGLPSPERVEVLRGDWLDFRRHRPSKERLRDARRASGLTLQFLEPVEGPIVLGALSHFGLGIFVPND